MPTRQHRSSRRRLAVIRWLCLTCLGLLAAAAQGQQAAADDDARFARYPAGAVYRAKPKPVNLSSHRDARRFRTRLRAGAQKGPNFAGHMTVVMWGCGTSCQIVALVDARTGRVTFGPQATLGVAHRVNSRLLIVNPPRVAREVHGERVPDYARPQYHVWRRGRLVRVRP